MIKIENVSTVGWEPAIRGARNPMNSWDKSDSLFYNMESEFIQNMVGDRLFEDPFQVSAWNYCGPTEKRDLYSWAIDDSDDIDQLSEDEFIIFNRTGVPVIGPNDLKLLSNLAKAGSDEAKFRRMIMVYLDVTAPMYWWKEADTYKVGTVRNSCSTMHKIHAKEFTLDDFSCEHLLAPEYFSKDDEAANDCGLYAYEISPDEEATKNILNEYEKVNFFAWPENSLEATVKMLNKCRELYLETKDKRFWWQMIQLLPSSYNQRATLMLNYEVLANMYHARKNHKLDEWREFCNWIETLPYAKELIVGEEVKDTEEQLRARFRSYENRIRYLEEMMCKELYKAYDMSVEDISEKTGIAVSAVKYFVSDGIPASPLLGPARTVHGETVIRDADTGEQRVLKYTIGGE